MQPLGCQKQVQVKNGFERQDPSKDEFQITDIRGKFSKVEIKQLIKIIGGNPNFFPVIKS